MTHVLAIINSDLLFYGLLALVGGSLYLFAKIDSWFGEQSDYLSDDYDSDSDWGDDD